MVSHHNRLQQRMGWVRKRHHALIRGSDYLIESIGAFSKSRAHRAVSWFSLILFLLIAIVLGFSTVWRVWVIKTDFTFELGTGAVYVDWSPRDALFTGPRSGISKEVGIEGLFPWKSGELFPPSRIGTVYFPLWIPTVLLAIVTPVLWRDRLRSAWRSVFTARNPAEFCKSCGYNLKGSVSGICSECGTRIPKPMTSSSTGS